MDLRDRYVCLQRNFKNGACIYKAQDRKTQQTVAIKRIIDQGEGIPCTALREVSILKELYHPHIVRLENCLMDEGRFYLIFEYMDMDLSEFIKKIPHKVDSVIRKRFIFHCLQGLEYCHARGILHRDLKPQNLLVDAKGNLKICSFGLARAVCPPLRQLTHEVVTLWYRAPEILLGAEKYSLAVDMWSCGVIFLEMARKDYLFPADSEIDELFRIFRLVGTPTEEAWPQVTNLGAWNSSFPRWPSLKLSKVAPTLEESGLDLAKKMLVCNPANRISARKALSHTYFKDVCNTGIEPVFDVAAVQRRK